MTWHHFLQCNALVGITENFRSREKNTKLLTKFWQNFRKLNFFKRRIGIKTSIFRRNKAENLPHVNQGSIGRPNLTGRVALGLKFPQIGRP